MLDLVQIALLFHPTGVHVRVYCVSVGLRISGTFERLRRNTTIIWQCAANKNTYLQYEVKNQVQDQCKEQD